MRFSHLSSNQNGNTVCSPKRSTFLTVGRLRGPFNEARKTSFHRSPFALIKMCSKLGNRTNISAMVRITSSDVIGLKLKTCSTRTWFLTRGFSERNRKRRSKYCSHDTFYPLLPTRKIRLGFSPSRTIHPWLTEKNHKVTTWVLFVMAQQVFAKQIRSFVSARALGDWFDFLVKKTFTDGQDQD